MTELAPQLPSPDERVLLHELNHRINNEFASAIGVISIAAARSSNEQTKAALKAVETQLQSYAQVHHVLQMPEHSTRIDAGIISASAVRRCAIIYRYLQVRVTKHVVHAKAGIQRH